MKHNFRKREIKTESVYVCSKTYYDGCVHHKLKNRCRECKKLGVGGNYLCDLHYHRKDTCKKCKELGLGGDYLCDHLVPRIYCKRCKILGIGGYGLCDEHFKNINKCSDCVEFIRILNLLANMN